MQKRSDAIVSAVTVSRVYVVVVFFYFHFVAFCLCVRVCAGVTKAARKYQSSHKIEATRYILYDKHIMLGSEDWANAKSQHRTARRVFQPHVQCAHQLYMTVDKASTV